MEFITPPNPQDRPDEDVRLNVAKPATFLKYKLNPLAPGPHESRFDDDDDPKHSVIQP
ncbi:hypothetical protein ANO14919_062360 [Xylariales sp. No.14919]|nr:hypothetical protein ANO14919_062360 [Xylariales sp. No.14919]